MVGADSPVVIGIGAFAEQVSEAVKVQEPILAEGLLQ